MTFQSEIVKWYLNNKRDLPWRRTTDPYVIWLSEIILQQTRVEQGLPYFIKFHERYPTVKDFAAASETDILKLWQGLGYYSRGRNMLFTAREVVDKHAGVFPAEYEKLLQLKGVGEYTAAAISSLSVNEARAVVDGNVFRVLSRYFGISTAINSSAGKKEFTGLAQRLLENQQPSVYNQAIMEFGALHCKPKLPLCDSCPVQNGCFAFKNNMAGTLPVKEKKINKRIRHFNYFLCEDQHTGRILARRRVAGDIWQELYDLPLIETTDSFTNDPGQFTAAVQASFGAGCILRPLTQKKHLLTHQTIYVQFFALNNYIINFNQKANIKWVSMVEFEALPQPKVIADFIKWHQVKK